MRRVRQESAEIYEVSPVEIATALGLVLSDEDSVTLEHRYGDNWKLTVKAGVDESVDLTVPTPVLGDEALTEALAAIPLVLPIPEIPQLPLPPLEPGLAAAVAEHAYYPTVFPMGLADLTQRSNVSPDALDLSATEVAQLDREPGSTPVAMEGDQLLTGVSQTEVDTWHRQSEPCV